MRGRSSRWTGPRIRHRSCYRPGTSLGRATLVLLPVGLSLLEILDANTSATGRLSAVQPGRFTPLSALFPLEELRRFLSQ